MNRWSAVTALVAREAAHTKTRRNSRFFFLGVVAMLPAGALISTFINGQPISLFGTMPGRMTEPLLRGLALLVTGSIAMYGVPVSGGATVQRIALERRKNTWTLFRLTPIRGIEMAAAQWCASLLPLGVWVSMHVPIITLVTALQSPIHQTATFAMLALAVVGCMAVAAINVLAAAVIKQQRLASLLTLVLVAIWGFALHSIVFLFLLYAGWMDMFPKTASRIHSFFFELTPVSQVWRIVNGGWTFTGFVTCLAGLVCVIVLSLLAAGWFFKRENPYAGVERRIAPGRVGLIDRLRRRFIPRRRPIRDGVNPFFIQELRRSYLGYPFLALFYVSLPCLAFFGLSMSIAEDFGTLNDVALFWLLLVLVALLLLGSLFTGPMIARERDANTFDLVVLTGCTPKEIVWGKFTAGFAGIVPFMAIGLLSYMPIWLEGGRHYSMIAAGFATLAVCVWVQQTSGLCASLLSRNARDAASLASYFGIALLIGGPIVVMFARGMAFDMQTAFDTTYAPLSFTSPLFAFGYFLWMREDPRRGVYLIATLWIFGLVAWWLFRGAVGLLGRQMAGAGRHAAARQTEVD